jgi:hypothetical protein
MRTNTGEPPPAKDGEEQQVRVFSHKPPHLPGLSTWLLVPGGADPELPGFVKRSTRAGHNLMAVVDDVEASHAIRWAQDLVGTGVAEEYALRSLPWTAGTFR